MSGFIATVGHYALVRPTLSSREWTPVKITRAGKRFTWVETLHADPANRREFRETTRGLWDFPTLEAANAMLETMWADARAYAAERKAACATGAA